MSSILTSQGMFLATAMAVSGSVILLAFRLQKSTSEFLVNPIPRSCISVDGKKKKEKKKKKKRVKFAEDVVDPTGNSEEYRRMHQSQRKATQQVKQMPANRMALYNGILRDRVLLHRLAYSSY